MLHFSVKLTSNKYIKSKVFRYYCIKTSKSKTVCNNLPSKKLLKYYGQPTYETHPHLLKYGEVTPFIKKQEFQERRQKLIESIVTHSRKNDQNAKHHIIVIPSASKQYMSDKIPYVFRQNTDFLYLSGCKEPDSCLILTTTESPNQHAVTIFVKENDAHSELWDGPRTGVNEAAQFFGVDKALPLKELHSYIKYYLKSNISSRIWYDYMHPIENGVHKVMQDVISDCISKMWDSPKSFIHKLRLIKSPSEIALMQKTCDIAAEAITKTISASKAGVSEHQLFARVDYECRINGADFLAYPPVVAGGNRANIIHYINNNSVVSDGEMVLMDAGCEYHGYSSDITRTWPINGRFNYQQKLLYEAVYNVQRDLIALCHNFPTLDHLFDSMCILLGKCLKDLCLIPKNTSTEEMYKNAYQFCPHHVSHYLGMDVHDTPSVTRNIKIQPGMVITVEPGIYINYKHEVPPAFHGLGIRIEDDVLITENGPVILTKKCPTSLSDIESIANENQ